MMMMVMMIAVTAVMMMIMMMVRMFHYPTETDSTKCRESQGDVEFSKGCIFGCASVSSLVLQCYFVRRVVAASASVSGKHVTWSAILRRAASSYRCNRMHLL